jgi:HEAT repeat protein
MENEIEELIKKLYSKDGIQRKIARYDLVKIGKPAIKYLSDLLNEPKDKEQKEYVRWETIKTLSQITDSESIPVLIKALENDDFDVRWMAAEGLINIGEKSIKPLLKTLVRKSNSIYLLEGTHHVLKELQFKNIFDDKTGIINKLENYNLHPDIVTSVEQLLSQE